MGQIPTSARLTVMLVSDLLLYLRVWIVIPTRGLIASIFPRELAFTRPAAVFVSAVHLVATRATTMLETLGKERKSLQTFACVLLAF